jgi:trehalose/maltose hydrolase-like predicted phosphorylase
MRRLFHNANGYIGIRYDFEEGYPEEYQLMYPASISMVFMITPHMQAS